MTPTRDVLKDVKNSTTPANKLSATRSLDDFWPLSSSPASEERPRKRPRSDDQENQTHIATPKSIKASKTHIVEREAYVLEDPPLRRAVPAYRRIMAASLNTRRLSHHQLPTTPILQSLVSNHTSDVYRIHSSSSHATFDLPISCAFSNASKRGEKNILAVSTEEGKVEFMNTSRRDKFESEPERASWDVHTSAIFDVRWSPDDTRIATGSGEKTACVLDSETGDIIATLGSAHQSTIKQVQWDPHNPSLLATGSRDGNIFIWDLRTSTNMELDDSKDSAPFEPIKAITRAHTDTTKKGRPVKGAASGARSITSILYAQHREDLLYSSSSTSGAIKLWDLRQTKKTFLCTEISPDSTLAEVPNLTSPKRARGICSMVLDSTGSSIYAVAADSRVHQYSASTLAPPTDAPGVRYLPQPLSHPRLRVASFYVRIALSPCGQWLASGSTGGEVFVWSLKDPLVPAVVLDANPGHASKETAVMDWAADGVLAACSDDRTVRLWRPDLEMANQCREDGPEAHCDWARAC